MELITEPRSIGCPYCGEEIEIMVDLSVEYQDYIEDCAVCCRPIAVTVMIDGDPVITVRTDDDA